MKLTRRQWLILPVEMKVDVAGRRGVVLATAQGPQQVMVTFVAKQADSDFQIEVP